MRRVRTLLLLAASSLAAQTPDYFPLQAGNQWIYRAHGSRDDPVVVSITQLWDFQGRYYSRMEGWPGTSLWLRQDEAGRVWSFDVETGDETMLYVFQTGDSVYQGPLGEFSGAAVVTTGGIREVFLPYVGLAQRATEQVYDLIYARVGGVTVLEEASTSVRLSLDQPVDTGRLMTARITVRHTGATPLDVDLPSAQVYDLGIYSERSVKVYLWSDNKRFIQRPQRVSFGPGETNYVITVPLDNIPNGAYTVRAWLATRPPQPYLSWVGVEVRRPPR